MFHLRKDLRCSMDLQDPLLSLSTGSSQLVAVPVGPLDAILTNFSGHKAQDSLNHGFISESRIEHGVVNGTVRPVGMEIFLNEGTTLVVHLVDKHFCISFRSSLRNKALYLLFSGSIQKKDAECRCGFVGNVVIPCPQLRNGLQPPLLGPHVRKF